MSTARRKIEIARLREEGRQAYQRGDNVQTNPHKHLDATQWWQGYVDAETEAYASPEPEKRIVLMLNDYPIGVYTTEALADEAAEVEWKKREPRWKELSLTVGQSCVHNGNTKDPVRFAKYYYRTYEFAVDGEARL